MNINGTQAQYQNYTAFGTSKTKQPSSKSTADSFQQEILNWQKRVKEAIDKERENDSNGSIQMSEKQWRKLMEKVDNALNTFKDNEKEREQEAKKQLEEKNLIRRDTVPVSLHSIQPFNSKLGQTSDDTDFLLANGKRS